MRTPFLRNGDAFTTHNREGQIECRIITCGELDDDLERLVCSSGRTSCTNYDVDILRLPIDCFNTGFCDTFDRCWDKVNLKRVKFEAIE